MHVTQTTQLDAPEHEQAAQSTARSTYILIPIRTNLDPIAQKQCPRPSSHLARAPCGLTFWAFFEIAMPPIGSEHAIAVSTRRGAGG